MPDIQEQALTSDYDTDKIIQTDATSNSGITRDTQLGNETLPVGIYSLDGGGTWHDMADYNLPGGITIAPANEANIYTYHTDFYGVEFDISGSPSPGTVLVKFALLAISDQTYLEDGMYFEDDTLYLSDLSYMKIGVDSQFTRSASAPEVRTISHNLGYVPMVNAWIKDGRYSTDSICRLPCLFDSSSGGYGVRMDESNIYISTPTYIPTKDITVYVRIYLED